MRKILLGLLFLTNTARASFLVPDGSITTQKIADQNVTTAKIADSSVTAVKLAAANAVTGTSTGGNNFTGSTSFSDLASVTITSSGVRPIMITLMPDQTANLAFIGVTSTSSLVNASARYTIVKDGTTINEIDVNAGGASGSLTNEIPPSAIQYFDPSPSAGSHTYKIQFAAGGANERAWGNYSQLLAREL